MYDRRLEPPLTVRITMAGSVRRVPTASAAAGDSSSYVPREYLAQRELFDVHGGEFLTWRIPVLGDLAGLRGAVVQRAYSMAVQDALRAARRSVTQFAAWYGFRRDSLTNRLQGRAQMTARDIAAFTQFAHERMPSPEQLNRRIGSALRTAPVQHWAETRNETSGFYADGVMSMSEVEDARAEQVLDALAGVRVYIDTAEDAAADELMRSTAVPRIEELVRSLIDEPLPPFFVDPIVVRANAVPGMRGWISHESGDIFGVLPADWATSIDEPGHAVLDGRILLYVTNRDAEHRPTSARVLTFAPRDEDGYIEFATEVGEFSWNLNAVTYRPR